MLVCVNAYIIDIDDSIMMTSRNVVPSAGMAHCDRNPTAIRTSTSQIAVIRIFDDFFEAVLNKLLNKYVAGQRL